MLENELFAFLLLPYEGSMKQKGIEGLHFYNLQDIKIQAIEILP
ncbi:hypothetical protein BVRB_3g060390 [Beta vulgaris subsp. vulgaris]|nr:hypothetical protein BVRB_3g060390 [Beta vulgaris subsp. vulgaris]